jgi:hypothetical protein
MKDRLILVLFWILVLHLIVSAIVIVVPPLWSGTRLPGFYRIYVLPGPFFTDTRIIDNYSFSLSWQINGRWSSQISPAKEYFNRYHSSLNPSDLYRSRLGRELRLTFPDSTETDIKSKKEFLLLKQFLYDKYIPIEADSVRMWIVNNRAKNFGIRKDSIYITFPR